MNNIKRLRNQRKITQGQLAELVGTSYQQIQKLEKSERRLSQDWMQRLGKVFGVEPWALVDQELPKTNEMEPVADPLLWEIFEVLWDMPLKTRPPAARLLPHLHIIYGRVKAGKPGSKKQRLAFIRSELQLTFEGLQKMARLRA